MSIATIDADLEVRPNVSALTANAGVPRRRPSLRRGVQGSTANALLWCFDEQDERARFQGIQRRLIRLEAALFEEYGARLDSASKDCLYRLFVACPSVRAPLISAQPDGLLVATWRQPNGEELVIRCDGLGSFHYSMVARSNLDGTLSNRQWGSGTGPSVFFAENQVAKRIAS